MKKFIIVFLIVLISIIPTLHTKAAILDSNFENLFTDVSKSHWAYKSIISYVQRVGLDKDTEIEFHPNQPLTRGEFTEMFMQFIDGTSKKVGVPFEDITRENEAYPSIEKAISNGIIVPEALGISFKPNKLISREEAGTMFARALKLNEGTNKVGFTDEGKMKKPKLLGALKQTGIMIGHNDGSFGPAENLTRAQAVVSIERFINYQADQPLSIKEITLIITNHEQETVKRLLNGKINERNRLYTFEEISPQLKSFYSEDLLNNVWKKVYEQSFGWLYEPASLIPFTMARLDSSVKVLKQDSEQITVAFKTAADEAGYVNPNYITYQLIKQNDSWVIAAINKQKLSDPFTLNEAKEIVAEKYLDPSKQQELRKLIDNKDSFIFGVYIGEDLLKKYEVLKQDGLTKKVI